MPLPAATPRKILRRFRRNRRGSAAVEFALVAPLFFGLLFAIIELAMVFFASQVLETATQDSARMIMTGQAQSAAYTLVLADAQKHIYHPGSDNNARTFTIPANSSALPRSLTKILHRRC